MVTNSGRPAVMQTPFPSMDDDNIYTAYGLAIRSAIPLKEFVTGAAGRPQVRVAYADEFRLSQSERDEDHAVRIHDQEACFWLKGIGEFLVRGGSEIVVCPEKDAGEELVRLCIEGMMMAMALHQRGMCVLHASVVEAADGAIGFLGHVGAGKSSMAAALYSLGHRVVADDNAAIQLSGAEPMVTPAYPYIKLFPEIATSLGFRQSELEPLHPSQKKMAGVVKERFDQEPLPLRRLYILGRHFDPGVARMPQLQAVVELIRNSVPTRWGHAGDARQLEQCAQIARQVPVFAVKTFSDLASLPRLAGMIQRHCSEAFEAQSVASASSCA